MKRASDLRPSVAIIGAGWAGLACALKLARSGFSPVIFESAPEAGGRARRAMLGDTYRDNGQHLMLSGCRALRQLFLEIGVNLPQQSFAYSGEHRQLSVAASSNQVGLLFTLLQAKGFAWGERWALLRALFHLRRQRWQVPASQTVAQWLQAQKQPTSLIENFWRPLALAILNTPITLAAMTRLTPILRDTFGVSGKAMAILQPHADLSASVVAPLVKAIETAGGTVHFGERVTEVRANDEGRYALHFQQSSVVRNFDDVVIAVPPWALTHIDLPFDTAAVAERFSSQPIATVYLGFDTHVRLPSPLVQLAGPTAEDARIWAIDRAHCGEPGVIAVSLSAEGPWLNLNPDTLAARCAEQLQSMLSERCLWHKVVTIHKATPNATANARLDAHERQPCTGLHLTGDWTHSEYPATLEAAVDAGFETATQIISNNP